MRHLLLAFMIVLLPLRGWVGDVMAMELLGTALQPPTAMHAMHDGTHGSDAQTHDGQPVALHADCPGHAGTANVPASDAPHAGADCATCSACQICHSVGLTPIPPHIAAIPPAASRPQGHTSHFSSAERTPGFKPPIS